MERTYLEILRTLQKFKVASAAFQLITGILLKAHIIFTNNVFILRPIKIVRIMHLNYV